MSLQWACEEATQDDVSQSVSVELASLLCVKCALLSVCVQVSPDGASALPTVLAQYGT